MAILTPSRPPATSHRPSARSAQTTRDPGTGTLNRWLSHPMADAVLVAAPALVLLGIGAIMVWSASTVFSASQFGNPFYFVQRHVAFLVVALIGGIVAIRVPIEKLRGLSWLLFVAAGVLLMLTFTPLGYGVGGNKNWLNFGGPGSMLRLQPAEIAKLAVVVWGASVLAAKRKVLDQPPQLLIPFLPFSGLLILLVILQKDLGTALVLGALVMSILWCVGASWKILGGIMGVVALGVAALVAIEPSRMARILGFLDPSADPTGINHQPMQALYGLATGGWLGVGLGASRQKWGSLSEAHTDYVLAIIGEELGVVGTLVVIALFFTIAFAGIRVSLGSATFYGRLVAAGITSWLMIQALVNIMVVLRMLPVLGVPLPFVSYGGSALLANVVALGILIRCALEEPDARAWLTRRTKKKSPRGRLSAVLPGGGKSATDKES